MITTRSPSSVRVYLTSKAAKFLSRYHRSKLCLLLGEDIGKASYQSIDSGKRLMLT